jgi:endonuclease YncB( thermonuclease family)
MEKMKSFLIILLLTFVCGCVSEQQENNTIVSRLVRVVDGDTFICDIVKGYPDEITRGIGVRLRGIDTPELRDKRPEIRALARKARDYVKQRLTAAKHVELRNVSKGKYFRIIADVYIDESNLSSELLAQDYAKPYNGGTKPKRLSTLSVNK